MRLTELTFKDPEVNKLARAVATVFNNVSLDNLKYVEVTGTTNTSANTRSMFRHGMNRVPTLWFILEGRIYVPRHGADENEIDVRSTVTSEQFRLIAVA